MGKMVGGSILMRLLAKSSICREGACSKDGSERVASYSRGGMGV